MDTDNNLRFAFDRIAVLEQLVAALLPKDRIPDKLIQPWQAYVANWPENEGSNMTEATIRLVETARSLR